MLKIFNYNLSINLNPYLLVLFAAMVIVYAIYIYKYTIPQSTQFLRIILITIRSLFLILLLILIFEPTLSITDTEEKKPIIPIFIDNSSSIVNIDSTYQERIKSLSKNVSNSGEIDFEFYSFDGNVNKTSQDSVDLLRSNGASTNFQNIFDKLKNDSRYLTSAVIISDGIINDGSSSIYDAEELNFPVYTIGVGDTTKVTDVYISSILNNRFIYKETPTVVAAEISNQNLAGKEVTVSFKENNQVVTSQNIKLGESGINRVVFDYFPLKKGKQKLSIEISRANGETNFDNNLRSTFIDVMENKLNILVVGGAPSADFSAVFQSLSSVDEFNANKYLQVNSNDFIGSNFNHKLDSAQVLVLVNFPFKNTPNELIQKIASKISDANTPYFNLIGSDFESLNLKPISDLLPFTESNRFDEIYLAQPSFTDQNSSLLIDKNERELQPGNLPPIAYPNRGFRVTAGSKIIATANVNNVSTEFPMMITNNQAGRRSITLIGSNVWRWRIDSENQSENFFDQLLYNSIQWLRVSDRQRKFYVETSKPIYAAGEQVQFTAELYDDKLEPVNDGEITVKITGNSDSYSLKLANNEPGIYTGAINISQKGDYDYSATVQINGITTHTYNGKFNIGEVDLEKLQTVMNENYLKMLASLTGGSYNYIDNSDEIFQNIETLNRNKVKEITSSVTYDPLSLETILVILILLLSAEWFIRKKEGML